MLQINEYMTNKQRSNAEIINDTYFEYHGEEYDETGAFELPELEGVHAL